MVAWIRNAAVAWRELEIAWGRVEEDEEEAAAAGFVVMHFVSMASSIARESGGHLWEGMQQFLMSLVQILMRLSRWEVQVADWEAGGAERSAWRCAIVSWREGWEMLPRERYVVIKSLGSQLGVARKSSLSMKKGGGEEEAGRSSCCGAGSSSS